MKDQKLTLLSFIHLPRSAICTNYKQLPQLLTMETWWSGKPEDSKRTIEYNHFLEKSFNSLTDFPFFCFFSFFFLPLLTLPPHLQSPFPTPSPKIEKQYFRSVNLILNNGKTQCFYLKTKTEVNRNFHPRHKETRIRLT